MSDVMGLHVCRILIASIMEEYNRGAWEELIERCEEAGVDAFEINFSCPHGMPERKMGMAMGQDCQLLEVCSVAAPDSCVAYRRALQLPLTSVGCQLGAQ